jgi:2-polyprenyl-3-methyl-5-hydroxy-6-metoxy-1,4-benzoquinol methylase
MTDAAQARHTCRVCGQALFPEPLVLYRNMPGAAQSFPEAREPILDRGTDLAVTQCSSCGLVQLSGSPLPYYREVIRASAFSQEMRNFRTQQFRSWVDEFGLSGSKVLEIGCGRGEYLSLLKASGVIAHGLEYSADAVKACTAQGLSVQRGFVADSSQALAGHPFNAFFCFNFMEHWPDPVDSLRGIHDQLCDGGLGFVEVPNFDMILEKGLYSEFISDHLSYFTAESLAFTLRQSGFELLRCERIWHDYILSAVVKKRSPVDLSLLDSRRFEMTHALRTFIDRFPVSSLAIWGAGHQALATIALTGIGNSIKYVVDSAPFKQGKLTPATHIPIVPPSALKSDPASAIIVMAASYSDEVLSIIRRDYGVTIPVAILRDAGLEVSDADSEK